MILRDLIHPKPFTSELRYYYYQNVDGLKIPSDKIDHVVELIDIEVDRAT